MSRVITATFEDGMLKPDSPLELPHRARVRLVIEPLEASAGASDSTWAELERLWDEAPLDTRGVRMTRDPLHERD